MGTMNFITDKIHHLRLRTILVLTAAAVIIAVSAFVSVGLYDYEKNALISGEHTNVGQMEDLRLVNLNHYFDELAQFCVQTCYESNLYQAMSSSSGEFTTISLEDVKDFVRTSYFSRNDILSYRINFLNQEWAVTRSFRNQHPLAEKIDALALRQSEAYTACLASPRNYYVCPSQDGDGTIYYYHSLIRISDSEPVGLIELHLQPGFTGTSAYDSSVTRYLYITGENGQAFYSDLPTDTAEVEVRELLADPDFLASLLSGDDKGTGHVTVSNAPQVTMGGDIYILTCKNAAPYGITIYCFSSYADLMSQLRHAVISVMTKTILFGAVVFLIIMYVLNLLTRPLSKLTIRMQEFGEGQPGHARVEGCLEAVQLADSFNRMSDSIMDLIEQNYAVKLGEQNARMAALEAQVNPHFLYNTLQAIGSEALLADDMSVYEMLTVLADCLRYTLRRENTVPLTEEIRYVDNYFQLQKLRKGDNICLEKHIDENALSLTIPKISLQILVENSLEHGMSRTSKVLHITLEAMIRESQLLLIVTDDGCGMGSDELLSLEMRCHDLQLSEPETGIGLPNLYQRLRILHPGSNITFESRTAEVSGMRITLCIPLQENIVPGGI